MNLATQRWIDRWPGIVLCAFVSLLDRAARALGLARKLDGPPRGIVIILLSEMGSLVLAHEMFARLRLKYPDSPVHVLLFRKNREILDLMGVVHPGNVHTVSDKSGLSLITSLLGAILALRRARVDVALDCELFSRISSLLSWASGACIRVGFHRHTQEGLYRGSHINRPVPYNPSHHISEQFIGLVGAIDATTWPLTKIAIARAVKPPPMVALPPGLVDRMRARMAGDFPQLAGKPLVLVYPGGGILPIRAWPLDSYVSLCESLAGDGCAVAVIGLKDDRPLARELIARVAAGNAAAPLIDLTGYTASIAELLALLNLAQLLVTNDGGPGQFAALTPVWTLMLFGPETPALYAPHTPRCHSFYSDWPCSPCLTAYNHRSSFCDGDNQCLKVITPAQVLVKAREFLAQGAAHDEARTA
ncbi:MAG: glycosyltransferase family 9 protein [Comamonadaceae bacterium]|nr:MAG: glycosyltransferase family 9 protein [Comamonadaceae bacterium]